MRRATACEAAAATAARPRYLVRVDVSGAAWVRERAARVAADLARLGGAGLGPGRSLVFGFGTAAGRDAAVDLVRRRHGWTSAEPVGGGPAG